MKKIILSKTQHRSPSPETVHQKADQEAGFVPQEADEPPSQPSLPSGSPPPVPPDSPTRIQIKKEMPNDGYPDDSDNKVEIPIFDIKCKQEVVPADPRPMCRLFARGNCTSGSACIFKHEVDISQLSAERIYKFCWDFQNKTCTRPDCKDVHATIFEEQHYYNTGYLPPSALAHQKQENVQNKDSSSTNMQEEKNPSLQKFQTLSTIAEDCPEGSSQHSSQLKRSQDLYKDVGCELPDCASGEPLVKKCKNCDATQKSMETAFNNVKEKLRAVVRMKLQTEEVNKKKERLCRVLQFILTSNSSLVDPDDNRSPLFDDKGIQAVEIALAGLLETNDHNPTSPKSPPR